MDSTLMQFVITQVGLGGVAALAMWFDDRQAKDALRREKENFESLRTVNAELLKALNDNTRAMTGLEAAIEALTHERQQRSSRANP